MTNESMEKKVEEVAHNVKYIRNSMTAGGTFLLVAMTYINSCETKNNVSQLKYDLNQLRNNYSQISTQLDNCYNKQTKEFSNDYCEANEND